jgi:ATP-dependent Clp protease ATP-binding subunit ClpA
MDLATASHLLYPALKGAAKAARAAQARQQDRQQETKRMQTQVVLDPRQTGREAKELEKTLERMIVGQDEAIRQIVDIYQMNRTGMCPPGRPVGNLLFLGPTGSGKTRIVEATAEGLVGNPRAVIKVDCAEFQHSHEIAKLIGSPPGYLGHRETHPLLSQEVLNQHHTDAVKLSFVLFDEIEKASDALWNLLLGILDKATLTLGDNRKVDFSHAMIFLTSNLGASEMSSILSPRLGFLAATPHEDRTGREDERTAAKVAKSGIEAARKKFTPEFMNRLDKIVVFKPLGEPELRRILDIELGYVQQRIFQAGGGGRAFVFQTSEAAKDFLLREGIDPKYGARHLKRAIERTLVQPFSNLIATAQVRSGDLVTVDAAADGSGLTFRREAEGLPVHAMSEIAGAGSLLPLGQLARGAGADAARMGAGRSRRG